MPDNASTRNMLVFIHGMGEDTRESVEKEINEVLSAKLGHPIGDDVEVRAIAYNKTFNSWRKRAKEDWSNAVDALTGRVHFSGMKSRLQGMTDIDDDNFNRTHWLDVLLYMSNLGVSVQLDVARQLTALLREFNSGGNLSSRNLVIMGHSLGCTVLHDTLYLMWTGGFQHDRSLNLSGLALKFDALFQLANTSRLLKTMVDPTSKNTSVKPDGSGMIDRMYNVHHKYDPISLIKPFKINDLSRWLPGEDYPQDLYLDIELSGIHHVNTHALSHYLSDPKLYCPLFNEIVDGYDWEGCDEAEKAHDKGAIGDEVEALKEAIDAVRLDKIESITDIIMAIETLTAAQAGVQSSWADLTGAVKQLAAEFDS